MITQTSLNNNYYIYKNDEKIYWDILKDNQLASEYFLVYFQKALRVLDQAMDAKDLDIYITWDTKKLPSYGKNVVAIILGDEQCKVPAYFNKVRAIFKCYGVCPFLGFNIISSPSWIKVFTLLQFLKNRLLNFPDYFRYRFFVLRNSMGNELSFPVFEIPLGYYNQIDLPIKNFGSRNFDVFFAGSVAHESYSRKSLKFWLGTPKSSSRKSMLDKLNQFKQNNSEFSVELVLTSSFQATKTEDSALYSQRVMNSKICLVPRGASFETFRLFEAVRYGCVVISEVLPPHWFYKNAPVIQVDNWNNLPEILYSLLNDKSLLQEKHQQCLDWWNNECSEIAIGLYMATQLNKII